MKGLKIFEVSECVICRAEDVAPTTILKPCGHKAVCDACLETLLEQDNLCPMCRQKIDNTSTYDKFIDQISTALTIIVVISGVLSILFILYFCLVNTVAAIAISYRMCWKDCYWGLWVCIVDCKKLSWEDAIRGIGGIVFHIQ